MHVPGGLKVEPNPVAEGGEVTIQGDANATVTILIPGKSDPISVKLDKEGQAKLKAPVGAGKEFTVTDLGFPNPNEVVVDVVSTSKEDTPCVR
ncbi:MAG: hypothetical protein H6836_03295 [Planctomycetes bacterium]|nr:hypothetical protein [Planctomycetota bacterium]MCB9888578.1 hypothetical protein [Planctomycetota bacterium]